MLKPFRWPSALRPAALKCVAAALLAVSTGPDARPESVEQAWSDIQSLVGSPRCRVDADCNAIGVGARACGGPEFYLAWSTQTTEAGALRAAVSRHANLRKAADAKLGLLSTCMVTEAPAVQCQRPAGAEWGVCVALPTAPGPSGSSLLK